MIDIIGIVATAPDGSINTENGSPIFMDKDIDRSIAKMDQAFIRRTIETIFWRGRTIFVMGENAIDEIRGTLLERSILSSACGMIISGKSVVTYSNCYTGGGTGAKIDKSIVPDESGDLKTFAITCALEDGVDQIVVLGGRTVYTSFSGHYTEFYNSTFSQSTGNGMKKIDNLDIRMGIGEVKREQLYYDDRYKALKSYITKGEI